MQVVFLTYTLPDSQFKLVDPYYWIDRTGKKLLNPKEANGPHRDSLCP